jgi:hypothetical protein
LEIAMRSTLIIALVVALLGCQGEAPEPSGNAAAPAPEIVQSNVLQAQADALQKAKDVQAQVDAAEKQRQEELDKMTGN